MDKEGLLDKLAKTIMDGDEDAACQVAKEVVAAGIGLSEAVLKGVTKGLDVLGEKYRKLEVFLPELVLAGDAARASVATLISASGSEQGSQTSLGAVVIGTVQGDIHDIGKNIVALMLQTGGFEVFDLGVDVPVKKFVEKAHEVKAKIIAISALLSTTAPYQEAVIKYLKGSGIREKHYVVIGGAPISSEWATKIGADGYGRTGFDAKELCRKLVTEAIPPPLSQPIVME